MESYSLQWRNSTRKDMRSLPRQEVARIVAAVAQLARDPMPHGSQKLSGSERTYRIRVGDYRVVFPLVPKVSAALWERVHEAKLRFGGRRELMGSATEFAS